MTAILSSEPASTISLQFDAHDHAQRMRRDGWTVIPDLLSPAQLSDARECLERARDGRRGRSVLEGYGTERIHTLVATGKVFEDISEDPRILDLCDRFLAPNYLLSISQAICIHPGETAQPVHHDDSFYRIPRPRPPVSISTIFAVDAFTETNGGTRILPGTHDWSDAQIAGCEAWDEAEVARRMGASRAFSVEMPSGACLVYQGTLLHSGGANRSAAPRLAFSNQYCEPWARTQENFFLGIPPHRIRAMSPRLQALLGYSIHAPNMGHVTGRHPVKTLDPAHVNRFG